MIEIYHQMRCYGDNVKEILCCDCFYDEVYQKFEEKIEKDPFINLFDGTVIAVCNNILEF